MKRTSYTEIKDMNEDLISKSSKEDLKMYLIALDSYRKALYDTLKVIKNNHYMSMKFYDEKINKIKERINSL